MIFPVDVILKGRETAVTESLVVAEADPARWDDSDVREVLVQILQSIDRVHNPETSADRTVVLQGFSWIVEPAENGQVVIAVEIPMGAAVAGPFAIGQQALDAMI